MKLINKIAHFHQLGEILTALSVQDNWPGFEIGVSEEEWNRLKQAIHLSKVKNGWFEERFVKKALKDWGETLHKDHLSQWLNMYSEASQSKNVAVIAAGNIPLVGFHDFISVILSGHQLHFKLSSDDDVLIPEIVKLLFQFDDEFRKQIYLYDNSEQLKKIDAVIATGNNNSARYFEHYFGKYPHIIRKNRTSVSLIEGIESDKELKALGNDMFTYFGLGCRNVSHLLVPQEFDLNRIFGNILDHAEMINNKKYGNNYDYHKAIFLMNNDDLLENGFVMFRESEELFAPLSVIHYQRYQNIDAAKKYIKDQSDNIQVVIGKSFTAFGEAQQPQLDDYADGIDTMAFLNSL